MTAKMARRSYDNHAYPDVDVVTAETTEHTRADAQFEMLRDFMAHHAIDMPRLVSDIAQQFHVERP